MIISVEFTRDEIVKCGTCTTLALIVKKNELPKGWAVLLETDKRRETHARLICPTCNAAEIERWNPTGGSHG